MGRDFVSIKLHFACISPGKKLCCAPDKRCVLRAAPKTKWLSPSGTTWVKASSATGDKTVLFHQWFAAHWDWRTCSPKLVMIAMRISESWSLGLSSPTWAQPRSPCTQTLHTAQGHSQAQPRPGARTSSSFYASKEGPRRTCTLLGSRPGVSPAAPQGRSSHPAQLDSPPWQLRAPRCRNDADFESMSMTDKRKILTLIF